MRRAKDGFTLIEIVIALVLAGLLASLAGPMLSGAIKGNATALQNLSNEVTLQSTMEKAIARWQADSTQKFADFKNAVQANDLTTGFVIDSTKTGFCTISGTTFTVDTTLTSGNYYLLTLKNSGTGETLSMLFTSGTVRS
ncbi:type II secretion system protein [Solidesulfovibrio magneticus]|uniref:type II secretion system protein n=1 Tax=Solidesulfovibrio magneticus TaxID=184917 RepID=UPI0005B9A805|nr:type II secretion system protein [Solidesulfovibrio magneticus]